MRKALSLILVIVLTISLLPISALALVDGGSWGGDNGSGDKIDWGDISTGAEFVASNGVLTKYNGSSSFITIPTSITAIGGSAFSGCTSVVTIIIPEGVTVIESFAFSNCKNLKYVVLPKTLQKIETYAFNGCNAIEDIFYSGTKTQKGSITIEKSNSSTFSTATWHYNTCQSTAHVFSSDKDLSCNNCEWFKDHTHTYSASCDETCNNCGRKTTPTADHKFNAATCTDPKTCKNCGKTEGTSLAHKYDNVCDATCNLCGATRNASHTYKNDCDTSCEVCGEIRTVSPHSWEAATCTTPKKCSICKQTSGSALGHRYTNNCDTECNVCGANRTAPHNFIKTYSSDADSHWYECADCSNLKSEKQPHVYDNAKDMQCNVCNYKREHIYDNACDTTCNKCGLTREPTHNYKIEHTTSEHWWQCADCGAKTSKEKHIYDNDCDKTCNVCNVTRSTTGHKYSNTSDRYCNNCNQERIVISKQPASVKVAAGSKATITVTATGSGMNYQWQIKTGSSGWKTTKTSGYTTKTLTVSAEAERNGYQYRCIITDRYGNKVVSSAATLTVVTTKITTQPSNKTVAENDKATFSVGVTGVGIGYQWQVKVPGGSWKDTTTTGYKTSKITVDAALKRNQYQYRCVITDGAGKKTYSKAVTLTVIPVQVTKNPTNVKAATGDNVTFTISASGVGVKYQWQVKVPGSSWKNSSTTGNKTKTITVNASDSRNGYLYRCIVTDVVGNKATSAYAKLTVVKTQITKQPTSVKVAAGTKTTMTVTASGVGLKYQWQVKVPGGSWKNTSTSGNKTKTITISGDSSRNGYQYRCVITDGADKKTYSKAATLTVVTTKITKQPVSVKASSGTKAKITVTASGVGLKYQWQVKIPGGSWKNTTTSGYKTNTLTPTATKARNGYQYRCVITDGAGKKTYSKSATLTVK